MYDVSDKKQLFIDHRFIEASESTKLTVNPAAKRPGAILHSDRPWDAFNLIYFSIAEDEGKYKMWYQAYDDDQWGEGVPRMCYALSDDGLNWEKPSLGLVDYQGSKDNNILFENSKLAFVFIDDHGKPEERFKMKFSLHEGTDAERGTRIDTSSDGLHWKKGSRNVSHIRWDTQKMAFWDPGCGRYVVYLKLNVPEDNEPVYPHVEPIESNPPVVAPKLMRKGRSLGRLEMDDITQPWHEDQVQTVMTADEMDPPDSDIYHHNAYLYPYAADAYFMFPFTYQHFRENETTVKNDGLNDVQFCASRDGIHWMRYDRRSYITRGLPGEPDCGQAHSTPFTIRRGNYLIHYYTGWPWTHGGFRRLTDEQRRDKANWGRGYYGTATQRLDGFVSVDAAYEGGWILTPPITFKGNHLELNIDVAAMGQAGVELQDEEGKPFPGYSLEDCDRVLFNDVAYTVKWNGKEDVSSLAGKPVRLKIAMRSARLFAFQFAQG